MKWNYWSSALALAAALAPAWSAVHVNLPKDGSHAVWIEAANGTVIAGPNVVKGAKATLETGAAKNAGDWRAVAENADTGNVAIAKVPATGPATVTLKPDHFTRIGRVSVSVADKDGNAPTYAAVTLTDGAGAKQTVALRPADHGQAVFRNVASGNGAVQVRQRGPKNQKTVHLALPRERDQAALYLLADVALPDGMTTPKTAPTGGAPAEGGTGILRRLVSFLIALAVLGAGALFALRFLRARGVTAESALARAGIRLPDDDEGETAPATTVAEEAPEMVDPNVCPFCGGPKDPAGACPNCSVDARPAAAPAPAPPTGNGKRLVAIAGPRDGQVFPLSAPVSIGRDAAREIAITEDASLSRRHATLDPTGDETLLADEGSANGTWVNGRKVERQALRHGDEIWLGASRFRYEE